MKHDINELRYKQALPLEIKVKMTELRIREWVQEFGIDGVYISFSGGKDSTVLLDIARKKYPNMKAVFIDTGLEYPEIRDFVRNFNNVDWIRPKKNFRQVIQEYGYPVISKDVAQTIYDVSTQAKRNHCDKRQTQMWVRAFDPNSDYAKKYPSFSRSRYDWLNDAPFQISHLCCNVMKKLPAKEYEKENDKKPILAVMASESRLRQTQWLEDGCNAFDIKRPTSKPMSFWTEQDVLRYIKVHNLPIASIYGDVVYTDKDGCEYENLLIADNAKLKTTLCQRTGCMFCMFGCSRPNWDNFVRMKETHPKLHDYILKPFNSGGLGFKEVIDWMNQNGDLKIKY